MDSVLSLTVEPAKRLSMAGQSSSAQTETSTLWLRSALPALEWFGTLVEWVAAPPPAVLVPAVPDFEDDDVDPEFLWDFDESVSFPDLDDGADFESLLIRLDLKSEAIIRDNVIIGDKWFFLFETTMTTTTICWRKPFQDKQSLNTEQTVYAFCCCPASVA